jgi:hypothetical protein
MAPLGGTPPPPPNHLYNKLKFLPNRISVVLDFCHRDKSITDLFSKNSFMITKMETSRRNIMLTINTIKRGCLFFVSLSALLAMSCALSNARGWSTNCSDGGWATIPFSDRVDYGLLWEDVTSLVSKRFEIEMVTKESGYVRTKWDYRFATDGKTVENYRTRVTLKINERRKNIEVRSEAEKLESGSWFQGCDTRVLETMKQDLKGVSDY